MLRSNRVVCRGTNYVMWQPWRPEDATRRFRFVLQVLFDQCCLYLRSHQLVFADHLLHLYLVCYHGAAAPTADVNCRWTTWKTASQKRSAGRRPLLSWSPILLMPVPRVAPLLQSRTSCMDNGRPQHRHDSCGVHKSLCPVSCLRSFPLQLGRWPSQQCIHSWDGGSSEMRLCGVVSILCIYVLQSAQYCSAPTHHVMAKGNKKHT